MGEIQDIIYPDANSPMEALKLNKLCAFKIQWWCQQQIMRSAKEKGRVWLKHKFSPQFSIRFTYANERFRLVPEVSVRCSFQTASGGWLFQPSFILASTKGTYFAWLWNGRSCDTFKISFWENRVCVHSLAQLWPSGYVLTLSTSVSHEESILSTSRGIVYQCNRHRIDISIPKRRKRKKERK